MTITGTMKNQAGQILTGSVYAVSADRSQLGPAQNIINGQYSIEATTGDVLFLFSAPGYAAFVATANDLRMWGEVVLDKADVQNSIIWVPVIIGILLLMKSKGRKQVGKFNIDEILPILLIGGGLLGFNLIQKLLQSIGIWSSPDTKALDNVATDARSFWNPNFYKQFSTYSYAITRAQAVQYIQQIMDAFGAFNDCEDCVIAVFKQLKTKSNVSYLSDVFYQTQGQDLLTYLRGGLWPQDHLSDSDVNTINNFLSQLPNN